MRWSVTSSVCLAGVLVGALAQGAEDEKPLKGKKALFVIAPRKFRDEEFDFPTAILKARGCAVTVACSSLKTATGMLGGEVKPDVLLKDAKAEDYDAVVFVGGAGAKVYFDDAAAHALAKAAAEQGKVVAAICIAPSILARAGVLKGKLATAWPSQKSDLAKHGARWSSQAVVRDGTTVTGNGPKAARLFGQTLVQVMAAKSQE